MQTKVAVYGTGTIGSSWAALFAARGCNVRMYDLLPEAREAGFGKMRAALRSLFPREEETHEFRAALARVEIAATPEELLRDTEFIQESVVERYPVKREAHETIERFARPDAVIASSSSGLLAHRMQEGLARPERFLVAHPFNPPHLIPLVELVPGPRTNEDALAQAHAFYTALGKVPVVLRKEIPGHIANRIAAAVWRETIDLVASGAASLEDVDKALCAGPGLRWAFMGQHLTYHLNGGPGGYANFFAHFGPALESYMADLVTWTEVPAAARAEVLRQMEDSVRGKSIPEMEAWRDERLAKLVEVLYAREKEAVAHVR
ncbi:MAG: 3-hydroxyacyl-CoA dehydrogenase family protein [Planctomycetota bacterium]|nr:3-hydroxyacyl-CoA dehydrogenase family protein [Planctomycetota bacterium]